jgi:CHAT domain-containing protein
LISLAEVVSSQIMFTLPRATRRWFLRGLAVIWLGTSMSVSARNVFPADVYGPELVLSLTETQQLHEKAWTLYYEGRYANAWEALNQALKVTESLLGADHKDMAILQTTAAEGYRAFGEMDRGEALLSRSLLIAEKSAGKDSPIVGRILKDFADFKLAKGQIKEGEEMLARYEAVVKQRYPQDHPARAMLLAVNGLRLTSKAKYEAALDAYRQSSEIIVKAFGADNFFYADNLLQRAQVCISQADYAQASSLAERSLQVFEKVLGSEHLDVARSLDTLASAHELQDDYRNALPIVERSLTILGKSFPPEHLLMADPLYHLGRLHAESGDALEAMKCFTRALKIYEANLGHTNWQVANTLNIIGDLLFLEQHNDEALRSFREALAIHEAVLGSNDLSVADDLYCIGKILYATGERAQALEIHRKCLEIQTGLLSESHPRVACTLLFLALESLAGQDVQQGLDYAQRLSSSCRQQSVRQAFGSSDLVALELPQSLVEPERLESIFAEALRRGLDRARTIGAEQLALGKALLVESQTIKASLEVDPNTSTRNLRDQYRELQSQLEKNSDARSVSDDDAARRKLLQLKLIQIESELGQSSRRAAQTILDQQLSLSSIARALTDADVLVDFVQFDDLASKTNRYAAYLTFPLARDSTDVVVERVDLGEAAPINEAVELVCKRMSAGQFAAKDLPATLQKLSQLVYAPLDEHLKNVSHIIICPDGQLSRLPFEMLRVRNKFLVEEKTISYVTRGREVVRLASSKSNIQRSKSLVMGNPDFDFDLKSFPEKRVTRVPHSNEEARGKAGTPVTHPSDNGLVVTRSLSRDYRGLKFPPLRGAEAEARSVAKLLGGDGVLRLGAEAREAELKSVQSPRVLDLATHGFFLSDQEFSHTNSSSADLLAGLDAPQRVSTTKTDWENPLVRCGIALAGANRARQITNAGAEDGLLTGLEASLLNLQGTELVILSACDSGAGEVKIGEGVMSLGLAFRIAGAETVLASHWKVSDKATSLLMTEFMRRWRAGESRANAWREAQLSLLHSKDFSNPLFWSAFTLTGQWR